MDWLSEVLDAHGGICMSLEYRDEAHKLISAQLIREQVKLLESLIKGKRAIGINNVEDLITDLTNQIKDLEDE